MHSLKELRKMDLATLVKELVATRFTVNKTKLLVIAGKEKASHKVKNAKKHVARILTAIKQQAK